MFLFEELSMANELSNNIETIDSANSISNNQLAPSSPYSYSESVDNKGILINSFSFR
jgi:hypothetical protein